MSAFAAIRRSALRTADTLPKDHSSVHVKLTGLPRTATPADITRLLAMNKVHNITKVTLDYRRFEPTGCAFLTLSQPSVLPKTLASLKQLRMRSRGLKGREEASERSIVAGTGSQAGITDVGRSVLLSGLPGKISTNAVRRCLNDYNLMGGQAEVVKMASNSKSTMTSRVLVRLCSPSEAFRLLRNLHMTNYEPDVWGDKYIIRAKLIC
ncbi:hypothetical protein F5888DRAFT_1663836 [Russula emetica]|nr:hypothetical protein F5888DRAFT_1663836 [Russula emetica]